MPKKLKLPDADQVIQSMRIMEGIPSGAKDAPERAWEIVRRMAREGTCKCDIPENELDFGDALEMAALYAKEPDGSTYGLIQWLSHTAGENGIYTTRLYSPWLQHGGCAKKPLPEQPPYKMLCRIKDGKFEPVPSPESR